MKKLLYVVLALVVLSWLYLAFVGVEPKDRRPGTLLSGDVAPWPANPDFLNADSAAEVHLETRPWYGVPFSVTTVIASGNGLVVVPSIYGEVMEFPGNKYWNGVVVAEPDVRLRVAGTIYELSIQPITDADEFQQGLAALAATYPFWAQQAAEKQPPYEFALLKLSPRL